MSSLPHEGTFTRWNRYHSSKSRIFWSEKNAPQNFINIQNCQTIQFNYHVYLLPGPTVFSSTPKTKMNPSDTGQPCVSSGNTSVGSPLMDSSLTASSWSLPTCGQSPGNNPTKSPTLLNTLEPTTLPRMESQDTNCTIPKYIFNESMMEP